MPHRSVLDWTACPCPHTDGLAIHHSQLYPLVSQPRIEVQRIAYRLLSKIIRFNTAELVVEMAAAIGNEETSQAPKLAEELLHQIVQPMRENEVTISVLAHHGKADG